MSAVKKKIYSHGMIFFISTELHFYCVVKIFVCVCQKYIAMLQHFIQDILCLHYIDDVQWHFQHVIIKLSSKYTQTA